ncbi:MAG: M14-type cytosolic carboxypeptidase [Armatimonadota bacterium]
MTLRNPARAPAGGPPGNGAPMSLTVDTDFPGGNACAIEIAPGVERGLVRFAADPHGGTEALWFHLRVRGCQGSPVELVLTNVDSCLGSGAQWEAVRPVWRQEAGGWERLDGASLHTLDDGRHQASWVVQPTGPSFELALCYPYGPDDLAATLDDCGTYWRQDAIGVTSGGRPLRRLSNPPGNVADAAPGVFIVARQHSGETPGSWVLDGLLRRAAETVDPADLVLWAIPFANLDGVLEGDYGKDPFPHDLNRAWTRPHMRHEVGVLQRDLARWTKRCRPACVVDLHAPGATEADGAYFHLPRASRPTESREAARALAEAVLRHLPKELMRPEPLEQPTYASRWRDDGTLGAYVWGTHGIPCLAMETPYTASRDVVFTRDTYRQLGGALLDGVLGYLRR